MLTGPRDLDDEGVRRRPVHVGFARDVRMRHLLQKVFRGLGDASRRNQSQIAAFVEAVMGADWSQSRTSRTTSQGRNVQFLLSREYQKLSAKPAPANSTRSWFQTQLR